MKLPKEYEHIRSMAEMDIDKALDWAYEAGFKDGQLELLKELIEEKRSK